MLLSTQDCSRSFRYIDASFPMLFTDIFLRNHNLITSTMPFPFSHGCMIQLRRRKLFSDSEMYVLENKETYKINTVFP